MTKEEKEELAAFTAAALQGWLSRYPEGADINKINYDLVSTGVMRMSLTMFKKFKRVADSAYSDKEA